MRAIVALFTGTLAASLAAGLTGCTTYGARARQVQEQLVGLHARSLRFCIGDPASVDSDGDIEYVTYRWAVHDTRDSRFDVEPEEPKDPRRKRPWEQPRRSDDKLTPGYCELVFEIRERHVQHVAAEGRTGAGLNADARCILMAERCLKPRASR